MIFDAWAHTVDVIHNIKNRAQPHKKHDTRTQMSKCNKILLSVDATFNSEMTNKNRKQNIWRCTSAAKCETKLRNGYFYFSCTYTLYSLLIAVYLYRLNGVCARWLLTDNAKNTIQLVKKNLKTKGEKGTPNENYQWKSESPNVTQCKYTHKLLPTFHKHDTDTNSFIHRETILCIQWFENWMKGEKKRLANDMHVESNKLNMFADIFTVRIFAANDFIHFKWYICEANMPDAWVSVLLIYVSAKIHWNENATENHSVLFSDVANIST